ncbi:hypothetical protein AB0C59_18305 [Streptomyces sp. NPDC048664]|uniref:hypothetical protein n=1 Tax=Streptomyces sp. NPDC048664 TaxID=3154505 RepID=UPI00342F4E5C
MAKPSIVRATAPDTVWLARGRHLGPEAEDTVRRRLRALKRDAAIQNFYVSDESDPPDGPEGSHGPEAPGAPGHRGEDAAEGGCFFEARWTVADDVVVRARLDLRAEQGQDGGREWVLVAEADRGWELDWPSPATFFWPDDEDSPWDHDVVPVVPGLRFRQINPLPSDDRALKRLLKECGRHTWAIHVVIHEAMTTDDRGLRPLASMLPPSLRHRVVEHRAAPEQFQVVNWALYDLGVRVPRGGAVVLPAVSGKPGVEDNGLSVRSVFLDGSVPTDLVDVVRRRAEPSGPLPEGGEEALDALREQWHLRTLQEELDLARSRIASYAEALDAMTKSRDLYREAADLAHEALAGYQETFGALPTPRQEGAPRKKEGLSVRARRLGKWLGDGGVG